VFKEVTYPESKKVMVKIEDKWSEASVPSTTACTWIDPDLNDTSDPDDDFAGGTVLSGCTDGVLKLALSDQLDALDILNLVSSVPVRMVRRP
jgi:hypothetical protein